MIDGRRMMINIEIKFNYCVIICNCVLFLIVLLILFYSHFYNKSTRDIECFKVDKWFFKEIESSIGLISDMVYIYIYKHLTYFFYTVFCEHLFIYCGGGVLIYQCCNA